MFNVTSDSVLSSSRGFHRSSGVSSQAFSPFQSNSDDPVVRDYVASMLCSPLTTLASVPDRLVFINALFGDPELATNAEDDRRFYLNLVARAVELARQAGAVLENCSAPGTEHVLSMLAVLATLWPVLLDDLEHTGIVWAVVAAMHRVGDRIDAAARGLTVLRTFATTDIMRRRVMVDGGVEIALQLMWEHKFDRRVQQRAATFIANVAFGCAHRKRRIAQQGAVGRVVEGMIAFPRDASVQSAGALMIRNLTADAQVNQYIAGNEGAVDAVAYALLRFRASSCSGAGEVRLQCVLAMESLCREDERNRQRVVDIDFLAMSKVEFGNDVQLLKRVAGSVGRSKEDEYVNEDGDVVVDEEEVLAFDNTPNFRHGAALCPGRSPLYISPSSLGIAGSDGTGPAFAMYGRKDIDIDRKGRDSKPSPQCRVQPNEKKSILRALVHTMRRDPDDCLLLETCLSLLTRLSLRRSEVQLKLGDLGGIQVAIAAIKRHRKSKSLIARGCSLIRCLCLQKQNRSQATSGLPVLISVAREYYKHADVAREVASALSNAVFEHEKNQSWVIKNGGMEAVVKAMDECGRLDVMVLEAGVCALRNFIDSSYYGALSAKNEGAVKAAVTALSITKDAASMGQRIVQEQAVLFLVDVAQLAPQTTGEMEAIDAGDWIENSLAKLSFNQHPELHKAGDKLITVLTANSRIQDRAGNEGQNQARLHPSSLPVPSKGMFAFFSFPRKGPSKGSPQPTCTRYPGLCSSIHISNLDHDARDSSPRLIRVSKRLRRSAGLK